MTKLKYWVLIFGLFFISFPSKGFDIQSYLVTPDFFLKQTDYKRFKGFNDMKLKISAELYDIFQEENINQTIDSLLIKSSHEDPSEYIMINERESMLVFFFKNACGMPTKDVLFCDDHIIITDYISAENGNIGDGNVETNDYINKEQIDIMHSWYLGNKKYIKPVFIEFYIDLLSHYLALQYIYTMNYPNKDPNARGYGVIYGWKKAIWHYTQWKPYGRVTYEFALKANGLFKSLISMFYWYKRNDKNTLPPDYIIKCGIEMNNEPLQKCNNCHDPYLMYY